MEESVPSCNPMREIEISFICGGAGAGAGMEDGRNTNTNKLRTYRHLHYSFDTWILFAF